MCSYSVEKQCKCFLLPSSECIIEQTQKRSWPNLILVFCVLCLTECLMIISNTAKFETLTANRMLIVCFLFRYSRRWQWWGRREPTCRDSLALVMQQSHLDSFIKHSMYYLYHFVHNTQYFYTGWNKLSYLTDISDVIKVSSRVWF